MTYKTDGQPTFVPANTFELIIGEKIENGDLKWHTAAQEWTEIQTLGYRIVKAQEKGLYRRRVKDQNFGRDPERQKAS